MADEVSFPVGYEVPRSVADVLGSWWDDPRGLIQPSEFIVRQSGSVVCSSYSDGPIGRFDAEAVLGVVRYNDKLSAEK